MNIFQRPGKARGADLVIDPRALQQNPRRKAVLLEQIPDIELPEDDVSYIETRVVILRPASYETQSRRPPRIQSITDVVRIAGHVAYMDHEEVVVLALDDDDRLLGIHEYTVGGISSNVVDPLHIIKVCYLLGASKAVLIHNHPSGSMTPSGADIDLTSNILNILNCANIKLVDHLIFPFLASQEVFSFARDAPPTPTSLPPLIGYKSRKQNPTSHAVPGADFEIILQVDVFQQNPVRPLLWGGYDGFVIRTAWIPPTSDVVINRKVLGAQDASIFIRQTGRVVRPGDVVILALDPRNQLRGIRVIRELPTDCTDIDPFMYKTVSFLLALGVYAFVGASFSSSLYVTNMDELRRSACWILNTKEPIQCLLLSPLDWLVFSYGGGDYTSLRDIGVPL